MDKIAKQMPTHGASKVQSQDEITTKRTDKSQQRMGICQEEAKDERIHKRLGRLLSPCRYEVSLACNRRMAKAQNTNVYMESLEESQDESGKPRQMRYQ